MAQNTSAGPFRIGTRASALARAQTDEVALALQHAHPAVQLSIVETATRGDQDRQSSLSVIGGTGVFVKELEQALLTGHIDLAVHSLKDLPPRLAAGLALAAVTTRADPRDVLISRNRQRLEQLSSGACIGTGSGRRRAQILELRPDVAIVDVRGNVDTRIRKVSNGEVEAVVLAAAGLARLGRLNEVSEVFSTDVIIPSPGQGVLALECRADDSRSRELASALNEPSVHVCITAERSFLARLGAGCTLPVAAYAELDGANLRIAGMLATSTGAVHRECLVASREDSAALGGRLAEHLLQAAGDSPIGQGGDA